MDLRTVKIMRISDKYVRSLFPKLKINQDHYFDKLDESLENADATIEDILKGNSTE